MINLNQEYVSKSPFVKRPKAKYLAVFCSDPNYRAHFEEFLDQLENWRVDRMVEPGGPLVLLFDWEKSETIESSAVARMKLLVEHHQVEDALLFGHSGCAAYQAKYTGQSLSKEQLDELVKKDLLQLRDGLLQKFPQLQVHTFFVKPSDDNGGVRFIPLSV